jgi:hypothetical protein
MAAPRTLEERRIEDFHPPAKPPRRTQIHALCSDYSQALT